MAAWPESLAETRYLDATGELLQHYSIDDAGYLLVRPDGYIACGGPLQSAEDLLHNLRTVLHWPSATTFSSHQQYVTPNQLAEV